MSTHKKADLQRISKDRPTAWARPVLSPDEAKATRHATGTEACPRAPISAHYEFVEESFAPA